MKKLPRYSFLFYKRALKSAVAIVGVLSLLLFLSFGFFLYRNNLAYAQRNVNTENEKNYLQMDEVLGTCTRICMFFSQYKTVSPVFQSQTDVNLHKATLEREISTFISCFDYIAGIRVNTGDYIVTNSAESFPADDVFISAQTNNFFAIKYSNKNSWPNLLQVSYTEQNQNTFAVDLNIYARYLSRQYLGENTYCLAKDGTILLAGDTGKLGKNISEITGLSLRQLQEEKAGAYLTADHHLRESDLIVLTAQSRRDVHYGMYLQIALLFFACMFLLSVSILLIYVILRRIYRPVENVVQVFKYYLPSEENFAEEDIRFISACVGDQDMEEPTRSAVLQIRKSQLHTLHSQISPHFLGNSLDIIKWESVQQLGLKNPIAESLGILSMFLSEAQQYTHMFTTIGEEIERTKQYIRLAVLCFNSHLQVEWDVEPETLHFSIISLTLQPLIENSVIHGFVDPVVEARAKICISIHTQGSDIRIVLQDNGCGMEPDVLAEIQQVLANDEPCSHHIGLKNTHLKLKLLYGREYGITSIQSSSTGTRMELLIPQYDYPLR